MEPTSLRGPRALSRAGSPDLPRAKWVTPKPKSVRNRSERTFRPTGPVSAAPAVQRPEAPWGGGGVEGGWRRPDDRAGDRRAPRPRTRQEREGRRGKGFTLLRPSPRPSSSKKRAGTQLRGAGRPGRRLLGDRTQV